MEENKSIVIAEDQSDIAHLVDYRLTRLGYDVTWGKNGKEALDFIREKQPALVILDVMMPIMDGFEVLRELKSNPETEEIPVIMLTARSMEEDILKGFDSGAVDYIVKPFSVSELAARVKAVLDR
ncbi:MAG: response regulator [Actinobacteria bacterium]|nr:response regulator [Actinomycetota bacterium]